MKALTLYQPYATAIERGHKLYETRSWQTSYRGLLAIHASAAMPRWAQLFAREEQRAGRIPAELPMGAIVAVAQLTGCYPTEVVRPALGWLEERYGDYRPGRFAWKLEHVRPLLGPIPARGRQQLWTPPPEVVAELNLALALGLAESAPDRAE